MATPNSVDRFGFAKVWYVCAAVIAGVALLGFVSNTIYTIGIKYVAAALILILFIAAAFVGVKVTAYPYRSLMPVAVAFWASVVAVIYITSGALPTQFGFELKFILVVVVTYVALVPVTFLARALSVRMRSNNASQPTAIGGG